MAALKQLPDEIKGESLKFNQFEDSLINSLNRQLAEMRREAFKQKKAKSRLRVVSHG
ncbi:hypothetical protein [Shewanella mangrovisoli]|uniref:hypothetical protein n=1 Tax=Shewanella mangrovisoli TaxID=2864211 RepID=UPI0035B9C368